MKFAKYFSIALLITTAFFFTSCSKNSDDVQPPASTSQTVAGKWVGTYGFGNDAPTIYFAFNIKANGTIEELNKSGQSKGSGTWSLNGNAFTAKYTWVAPYNTVFSVAATYNAATKKLTGTWGYDNSSTDGGLWEQTQQ
jgi:hypothetical protein